MSVKLTFIISLYFIISFHFQSDFLSFLPNAVSQNELLLVRRLKKG